jgi:hypothetical protein
VNVFLGVTCNDHQIVSVSVVEIFVLEAGSI